MSDPTTTPTDPAAAPPAEAPAATTPRPDPATPGPAASPPQAEAAAAEGWRPGRARRDGLGFAAGPLTIDSGRGSEAGSVVAEVRLVHPAFRPLPVEQISAPIRQGLRQHLTT